MKVFLIFFSLLIACRSGAKEPIDCNTTENLWENAIQIKEFSCDSDLSCGVAMWAPSSLEGYPFMDYWVLQKNKDGKNFSLAFTLQSRLVDDQMVAYIYGAKNELERMEISVSYDRKNEGCPLTSNVKLKYNED